MRLTNGKRHPINFSKHFLSSMISGSFVLNMRPVEGRRCLHKNTVDADGGFNGRG